jgi:hypothetical protein
LIGTRGLFLEDRITGSIDWQKTFDWVNWTKLMQILKRTGTDWCERKPISNLYMAQYDQTRGRQEI